MRSFAAGFACITLLLSAFAPAWGQAVIRPEPSPTEEPPPTAPKYPAGWYVTPAFSVSESYDDNIFGSATNKQSDFITRFTPGIQLGYRSEPFTILGSFSFDAEIYAKNPELSGEANRKRAALETRYLPFRLLTVGLIVSYLETENPGELAPTAGVQITRGTATQLSVIPEVAYQLTPVDTLRATYNYTHETLEGAPSSDTHRGWLTYLRQLTVIDTGILSYRISAFQSEGAPTTYTHAPTLGWIRQLTPNTTLTLQGGPRFVHVDQSNDTSVQPEAHGRLEHTFRLFKVALDYLRSETFIVGRPGAVEVEAISGMIEAEPYKLLRVRFEPSYSRTFGGSDVSDPETKVYGFVLSAVYPLKQWLAARLNYGFAYQDQGGSDLTRNVITVGLDFNYPIRIGQ